MAYQMFQRASQLVPQEAMFLHNLGHTCHKLNDGEAAEFFFRKALKLKPTYANSLEGMGMIHLNRGEFDQAIHYCNRALAEEPDEATEARINRGMAYLALRRWREGWRDYNANVGKDKNRKSPDYGCPTWDGSKGKDVVVYGEQGIGDEISFASCIPDLIRDSKSITIECDGRLERLFERSFQVKCHGTRYKEEKSGLIPSWRKESKFDYKVAMGELCGFYRNKDSDFPRTAYLVPNPQMTMQWRVLLDSLGNKPKIGLTWSGGLPHTGQKKRSVSLDTYGPLFKGFDADWISLQYKDPDVSSAESKYGVKIWDWEWGTRVFDYDQTAALVSQLDLVISVTTATVDLCAGLGKECWCLVPNQPLWRHGEKGSDFLWGRGVTLHRQKGKEWPIHLLLGQLKDRWPKHVK